MRRIALLILFMRAVMVVVPVIALVVVPAIAAVASRPILILAIPIEVVVFSILVMRIAVGLVVVLADLAAAASRLARLGFPASILRGSEERVADEAWRRQGGQGDRARA